MLKLLLNAGLDIDIVDGYGRTPLCYAFFGNSDTVQALIDAGADVNFKVKDDYDRNVKHNLIKYVMSRRPDDRSRIGILYKNGARLDDEGTDPMLYEWLTPDEAKELVEAGADINASKVVVDEPTGKPFVQTPLR